MDSAVSVTTTAQMALFKALHRHLATTAPHRVPLLCRSLKCVVASYGYRRIPTSGASFASAPSLGAFRQLLPPPRCRVQCVSSSAASFAPSGGGGAGGSGAGGEGGGDGGYGGDSGDGSLKLVGDAAQEISALSPDVIILDVSGMTCGGCAATVKRILESRPQVSSASVNLTTETAIVWPVSEAKKSPNWQKNLGEALAEHLTNCGYRSCLRVAGKEDSN